LVNSSKQFLVLLSRLQSDLFTEHVYRRHLVDASVTDSLMSLKRESDEPSHVVAIYGYCAHATINEFAEMSLRNFIKSKIKEVRIRKKGQKTRRAKVLHISPMEKLHYASQVAKAVANLHKLSTLNDFRMTVYKDLKPDNIVLIQPSTRNKLILAKMSDFNDAEILLWNTTDDSPCRFRRKRWISEVG
jgi:serine/threonine protein kinase